MLEGLTFLKIFRIVSPRSPFPALPRISGIKDTPFVNTIHFHHIFVPQLKFVYIDYM